MTNTVILSRSETFQKTSRSIAGISVIFLAIFIPLSTAATEILAFVSAFFSLVALDFAVVKNIILRSRVGLFFLLFFFLFGVGLSYTSVNLTTAFHGLLKYLKFFLGFLFFPLFQSPKLRKYTCIAFLASLILTLFFSYFKFFTGLGILHKFINDSGIFKDHIYTSFFIALSAYGFLYLARLRAQWRGIFIFLFTLSVFDLFFINLGRSGYVVFIALMCLYGWQYFRWQGLAIALGILIIITAGTFKFSSNFKHEVIQTQSNIHEYHSGDSETSIGARLSFYSNSLRVVAAHPVWGGGTGSFAHDFQKEKLQTAPQTTNPHNEYLNISAQFGLIGLAILLLLFYFHARDSRILPEGDKQLAQAVLVAIAVGSLFNSWLMDVPTGFFYILFTALFFNLHGCLIKKKSIGIAGID